MLLHCRMTMAALLLMLASGLCAAPSSNLCPNGGFELLQEALARPLPQEWGEVRQGAAGVVEVVAAPGGHAVRLAAPVDGAVGLNSPVILAGRGTVRLRYQAVRSSVGGANLALCVIGVNAQGVEATRQLFIPPAAQVGDGQWHEATIEFDFTTAGLRRCLIAPRINEATPTGEGEWLIDDIEVTAAPGPRLRVAQVWCDRPLARTGEALRFSAFIENTGDADAVAVSVALTVTPPLVASAPRRLVSIPAGSYRRVDWRLRADKRGTGQVTVTAAGAADRPPYKILAIDRAYTRQELCTDEAGYWRLLERPVTLQEGNQGRLTPIKHKTSAQIKRNPYGICTHLPRAKDYEHPFNPTHLVDGDPDTCWSSQQHPSPYPGRPPWVRVDLGRVAMVRQVNLVPYWRNSDFPIGFTVRTSRDGTSWRTALTVTNHELADTGERRGDKLVQPFPFPRALQARYVRVTFERLPAAGGNYAEVSSGFKARLSGVEVIDTGGANVALAVLGAKATASDTFTGWQDTARTIAESFPKVFEIGLKWLRVGQWGDQTEWAAVERQKGVYRMDPATDAALQQCFANGVDILYGLNYGNDLYEPRETPWGDIGPIFTEGHPFYKHGGPRTEAGRQAFVRYVDYVVHRYGRHITWWELWNEENGWFPGHEPELYGKLLLAVAKHIKGIDPKLKVMFGGTAAPAPLTTEIALREGAAPYVDAYAFHPYGIDKPEGGMGTMEFHQDQNLSQSREQTGWNTLPEIVAGVRKPFTQHGRPDVEVWLNEWGTNLSGLDFTYQPGIGEYGCAKYLMRFYTYSGWLGLPTAWWALYNENKSQDWGILEQEGYGFRPMSYALQNVCSVVSDVTPLPTLEHTYQGQASDPKVIGYRRDAGGTLVLAWAAETNNEQVKAYPSTLSFQLPSRPRTVTLTDLYWGVAQPAVWTYQDGTLTVEGLVVRDYPVAVECR